MSVLIKTMTDLPEHCYDCPCHDGESGYCRADKEHRYSDYRPFWCPLVKINNIGDRVKFRTMGGWCNSGIIKDITTEFGDISYLIEVDELGCKPPKDVNISLPYYARVLSCEIVTDKEVSDENSN